MKSNIQWERDLQELLERLASVGNTLGIRNTAGLLLLECSNAVYHQIEFMSMNEEWIK